MIDLLHPRGVFIVGVEPDPDEADLWRIYIGHRSEWNYVLARGDEGRRMQAAWDGATGHLTMRLPEDAPIYHDAAGKAAARQQYLAEHPWPTPSQEGRKR